MKPLQVDDALATLSYQFPNAESFSGAVRLLSHRSRESVVRLWLAEGVPYAFRDQPGLYEAVRSWLGARLKVCPKDIALLGSARLGYSLARPHYGRRFDSNSDFDLSVVSRSLLESITDAFDQWKADYAAGVVEPRSETERSFWDGNIRFASNSIPKGFMDANKVPTWKRYPLAIEVGQAMWELKAKLDVTGGAPRIRKASIRVYESWQALVSQVSLSLKRALV